MSRFENRARFGSCGSWGIDMNDGGWVCGGIDICTGWSVDMNASAEGSPRVSSTRCYAWQ